MDLTDFSKIRFGYASAEKEGVDAPELLLDGFVDNANMTDEAIEGSRWLFLGYKGSGKSSIGERARLLSQGDPMLFVTSSSLHDFPYGDLTEVLGEGDSPSTLHQSAWTWLLLLSLLTSMRSDEAAKDEDRGFTRSVEELTKQGLLPARDLRTVVLESTTKRYKIQLPKLAEKVVERTFTSPEIAQSRLIDHVMNLVVHFRSEARHVLIIDGLDEVLVRGAAHYDAIGALMLAAMRLNTELQRWDSKAKVVVMCRADLFERVPGANRNKLRRDWAVFLDWYHDPRDPDASRLMELANLRGQLALDKPVPLMQRFFPSELREGETRRFLLDVTRTYASRLRPALDEHPRHRAIERPRRPANSQPRPDHEWCARLLDWLFPARDSGRTRRLLLGG